MGFAVKADGSFRAVDDKSWCSKDETYQKEQPIPVQASDQEEANTAARACLLQTDWYVIRQSETGQPVPEEILEKRQAARDTVKD